MPQTASMKEQRLKVWQQWRRLEKRIRAKDELYDVSMLRGYHCKNDGYGELLPCFSKQIAEVLNINRSHKVLDVGSGIGFLCFDLACLTGCSVKGIEIRRDIYLKSVQIAKHVSERMNLDVSFVYGDGTADTIPFKNMDIIVCCNTLWSGENNYRLLQKLCLQMRPGTRVVVLEQLGGQRYHEKSPRHQNDILSSCFQVPPQKFMSDPESVSWTSNPIPFYVYTKKAITRAMRDKLEKDRGSVLKTPKHRTDPHVAEMAGLRAKKRNMVADDEDDEEAARIMMMPRKRTKREVVKKEVEDSEMEDSEMEEEDADDMRVTRSAAKAAGEGKASKNSKNSKKSTTSKKSSKKATAAAKDASAIAAKKRRKRVVGVITSRIRRRTRAAIAKRQQLQQQRQQKLDTDNQDEKQTEIDEPRKTRSQTKAGGSSPSSPSFPSSPTSPSPSASPSSPSTPSFTTRSQVSSTTQFSSLPPVIRAPKRNPKIFDKASHRWPTVTTAVNGMKVSERRSQRFKKFNMNLNDFIA